MLESLAPWRSTSAWAAVATAGAGGAPGENGVRIEPTKAKTIWSFAARAGQQDALAEVVQARLGLALPATGRLTPGHDCDIVWSAPDQWLVLAANTLDTGLIQSLSEVAAVTDQSDARAIVTVSGVAARDALAKGFAIDLHPDVFTSGCTAVTSVAHMSVQIWQRDAGCYTIVVPRSFVAGFWSWLISASAIHGYEVVA